MSVSEAALNAVRDNSRDITLEGLRNRIVSIARDLERARTRCNKQEKALEEIRRTLRSTVLTREHYEALLFVQTQLEGCSRFVTDGAIRNSNELSSILEASANVAGRLFDAFIAIGVTMPDSPGQVESSPDNQKEDEETVIWELGEQFEDQRISELRRRVACLRQDLKGAKDKTAKVEETIAVLQNTPLLTHDKCSILNRIEKRTKYLAKRCRKDAIVPASVGQELDLYVRCVRQITNAFLVVNGAMALPTRMAKHTWACASDWLPDAIKAQ